MLDILGLITALLAMLASGLLGWLLYRERRRVTEATQRIQALEGNMGALCAGALGSDRRLSRLEKQGRDLACRLEAIEHQPQGGGQPYGEAIQLVQQGAGSGRLVEELGLTPSEAELVVMLHGVKEAV